MNSRPSGDEGTVLLLVLGLAAVLVLMVGVVVDVSAVVLAIDARTAAACGPPDPWQRARASLARGREDDGADRGGAWTSATSSALTGVSRSRARRSAAGRRRR